MKMYGKNKISVSKQFVLAANHASDSHAFTYVFVMLLSHVNVYVLRYYFVHYVIGHVVKHAQSKWLAHGVATMSIEIVTKDAAMAAKICLSAVQLYVTNVVDAPAVTK